MQTLPFGPLPPYKPRRFVPAGANLGEWPQIAPLFDALAARAPQCRTTAALESWLADWSELNAALDEEASRRHIAMTCHTDDAEAEAAFLHFVEKIDPEVKPRQFELAKAYAAHPVRGQLPAERYQVFDRDTRVQVELFRPENVALETEDAKLAQQFQKLSGSLTVQFQGEERTLVRMGLFLEEADHSLRQEAWETVANRRLQECEKFEELYDSMVSLRGRIATNAGFANYRDYAFRRLGRHDYTPADCASFHDAVETEVMPAIRALQAERRARLGVSTLRPWDLATDPLGRPPLRPFQQVEQMVAGTRKIFEALDAELADGFRQMDELHLLDLANCKGKAPGGYQSSLSESRLPFIFMNAVGQQRDVETILHEAGHAFHALATRSEDLFAYRNPPIEFCEVASMSMELLGNELLEPFYAPAEMRRARRAHLEGILTVLAWIATIDAFQHWVYTHPAHTRAERAEAWAGLIRRFGGEVDWRGYEAQRNFMWHRQLHLFTVPFYYIEYGIAQLGALQVWANSHRDKMAALAAYKSALARGGSRPLPELFAAAGCAFDFSRKTLGPLVAMVTKELESLPQQ